MQTLPRITIQGPNAVPKGRLVIFLNTILHHGRCHKSLAHFAVTLFSALDLVGQNFGLCLRSNFVTSGSFGFGNFSTCMTSIGRRMSIQKAQFRCTHCGTK